MTQLTLGELANSVMAQPDRSRVVALTVTTTGNPALRALDLTLPQLFVSVTLGDGDQTTAVDSTAERSLELLGLEGTIDLVIADPHHTYQASVAGVVDGLQLLRPGGVMLVHDCLPPPDLMEPEFQEGSWCGESYAAFRDVCRGTGLPWFTINADFGIGVVSRPARHPTGVAVEEMPAHDPTSSLQEYLADPYKFMRTVTASDAQLAIQRLVAGEPVDDLLEEFPGWENTNLWPEPVADGAHSGSSIDVGTAMQLLTRQMEIRRGMQDRPPESKS